MRLGGTHPGGAWRTIDVGGGAEEYGAVESFDIESHPLIATAFHTVTGDRSVDTYRLAGACYDAHLTLPQTRWAIGQRPDLTGRLNGHRRDDVPECWLKIVDQRQTGTRKQGSAR